MPRAKCPTGRAAVAFLESGAVNSVGAPGQFPKTPFYARMPVQRQTGMLLDMASDRALSALDAYIAVLSASADRTVQAEDRGRYRDHLANAARLFHLLQSGEMVAFKELLSVEQRPYGTAFLAGGEGAAAEAAFNAFADFAAGL